MTHPVDLTRQDSLEFAEKEREAMMKQSKETKWMYIKNQKASAVCDEPRASLRATALMTPRRLRAT